MVSKTYGPYKGSKKNGGRPIMVTKTTSNGKTKTTSTDAARAVFEKSTGKALPKNVDVDHKNNKGRIGGKNDVMSNLDAMSHGKNVAKENKVRAKKGSKK